MIKIINDYLTKEQCNSVINLWDSNDVVNINDNIYHFLGFDLIPHLEEVVDIIPEFVGCKFKKFRIQCNNETIIQVKNTHIHINPYSFVIFLNDNFTGGDLLFNNVSISPKIGTMVYFTGDEAHRVTDCVGERYTLVGFLHIDLFKKNNTILI